MSQESVAVVQPQDYPEDKEEADTDSCVATRMDHSSSVDAGGTPISSGSRKRKHPGGLESDEEPPPNKLLPTPSEQESLRRKQFLYQAVAEAEKNPFYLQPHQHPVFPFFSLKPGSFSPVGSVYPILPNGSKPPTPYSLGSAALSSRTATTATLQSTPSIPPTPPGSITGSPRPTYPAQFYPAFMKYPFSPPTPSIGLLSPWNGGGLATAAAGASGGGSLGGRVVPSATLGPSGSLVPGCSGALAMSTPKEGSGTGGSGSRDGSRLSSGASRTQVEQSTQHQKLTSAPSVTWPQSPQTVFATPSANMQRHVISPRPNFDSVQPSLNYFHPSPLSPMMLAWSPYTNSVPSCPSASSSSGCSSDGDGRSYAPSEYHVGPQRPLSEKYGASDSRSEEANNSGRNTPNYSSDDSTSGTNNLTLSGEVGRTVQSSRGPHSPLSRDLAQGGERERVVRSGGVAGQPGNTLYSLSGSLNNSQPTSAGSDSQVFLGSYPSTSLGSVERPSSGVSSMSSSLSSRDSTPDPDEHEEHQKLDPNFHHPYRGEGDVFCVVPGRLSLLGSTQKYKVTVDEVRRRLLFPECLNASVLGGILRRAKSKNGGHVLRQRLESIGLSLPPGRRKATELSLLTSLVEGEALHLSSDFRHVCDKFFPHAELAQIIARQHTGTPQAQNRISMVKATQLIVSELQAMLNAVGGPSNIRPNDPSNPYPGLSNFSLLSHGFGNPAINSGLGVLQNYLQELLCFYEGRKPIQLNARYLVPEEPPLQQASGSATHRVPLQIPPELLRQQPGVNLKLETPESPNDHHTT